MRRVFDLSPPAWAMGLGLGLVPVALMARVVSHPFVRWDDASYILSNRLVIDPGGASVVDRLLTPTVGYIAPVTVNCEAALYWLGSGAAWPFHALSLFVHGAVVFVLWLLAISLMGDRTKGVAVVALALPILVFALHPLVVEPVAWATGLKDLLMAVSALIGSLLFWRALEGPERPWAAALAFMMVATLAKPTGALLGLAWAVTLLSRRAAGRHWNRSAAVVTAVATVFGSTVAIMGWYAHNALLVDDPGPLEEGNWHALLALGYQIQHLLWPVELHPRYLIDRAAGLSDLHTLFGAIALLVMAWAGWRVRRDAAVVLPLSLAVFAYLPVSNLLPFPRFVADSYLYLPAAGLAVAGAVRVSRSVRGQGPGTLGWTATLLGPLVAAVLVAGGLSWSQVTRWSSNTALWAPTAAAYPDWPEPQMQIAEGQVFEGDAVAAAETYRAIFREGYTPAYLSLFARALLAAGAVEDAECILVEDIAFGPNRSRALHNLALMLATHPDYEPNDPATALEALGWARHAAAAETLRWPPTWLPQLEARAAMLESQVPSGEQITTKPGACPAFARAPEAWRVE